MSTRSPLTHARITLFMVPLPRRQTDQSACLQLRLLPLRLGIRAPRDPRAGAEIQHSAPGCLRGPERPDAHCGSASPIGVDPADRAAVGSAGTGSSAVIVVQGGGFGAPETDPGGKLASSTSRQLTPGASARRHW